MEKHPLLRPTDKRGKQPPTNFVSCFENAWERPLEECVSDSHPHTSEARIEVNDRQIPCSAQVRMHTEAGNFAWDRLASRMYAATATMFLMKKRIGSIYAIIFELNLVKVDLYGKK